MTSLGISMCFAAMLATAALAGCSNTPIATDVASTVDATNPPPDTGTASDVMPLPDTGFTSDVGAFPDGARADLCFGINCHSLDGACSAGVCNPLTGVCYAQPLDGAPCDDSDPCTGPIDVCLAGTCTGTAIAGCGPVLSFAGHDDTAVAGNATGGTRYNDDCPAGQVVVGLDVITVAANDYINQLAVVCGTPTVGGTRAAYLVGVGPGTTLPTRGTNTGVPGATRCPPDSAMTGFQGRGGLLVDRIEPLCSPIHVAATATGYAVTLGTPTSAPYVGGSGGTAFSAISCPVGEIATGAIVRAGNSLDGFGLRCSVPTAM